MGVALTLKQYLDEHGVKYDVTHHGKTNSSVSTAEASHISADCLAKGVLVKRGKDYLLVVLPASRKVELEELGRWLDQPVALAREDRWASFFPIARRERSRFSEPCMD